MQALNNRLDRVLLLGRCIDPDPIDQPQAMTDAQRMKAFLADFKATCPFYHDLSVRMHERIDNALALDPVPECLQRSFVVFERHCADERLEPMSVEAGNFLIMLPGGI